MGGCRCSEHRSDVEHGCVVGGFLDTGCRAARHVLDARSGRRQERTLAGATGCSYPARRGSRRLRRGARIKVGSEHMCQQPRPSFSRSRRVTVGVEVELELVARRRRRNIRARISGRVWHDFFSQSRVAREHGEVPDQVEVRWGTAATSRTNRSSGSSRIAHVPSFHGCLSRKLELAVGEPLEPVLGDRRAGDVATETLELSAVPPGGAGAGGVTGA